MITYVSEGSSKKGTVNPNKLMPFILNEFREDSIYH